MRSRLHLSLLIVLSTLVTPSLAAEPKARANIVFVLIDDMGYGDLGCFGGRESRTPHIDRLAAEGLRFEQFCVNSPICSPSRTAFLTGQYPQRWRITSYLDNRAKNTERGMAQWLDPRAPSLARQLQAAGYATGHFGKWHLGGQRDVGDAPLITEYGFDASLTNFEGLGPRVLPLLNAYDGKPPRKHALGSDTLGRGAITWKDRSEVTAAFVGEAVKFIDQAVAAGKPFYVNLWPDDVHSPFFPPAARRAPDVRSRYLGVLETMDEQLGVLFEHIRSRPALRDNTLIVLCSDNGPEKGAGVAGPLRGYKAMLYEGGVRSPLVVWGPGLVAREQAGQVNRTSLLAAIDLAPSLLALTGAPAAKDVKLDGQPLADVLAGRVARSRSEPIFFSRPPDRDAIFGVEGLPDLAVRDGKWKLLCEQDGSRPELYDLEADPGEARNLAGEEAERVQKLTAAVRTWYGSLPKGPAAAKP